MSLPCLNEKQHYKTRRSETCRTKKTKMFFMYFLTSSFLLTFILSLLSALYEKSLFRELHYVDAKRPDKEQTRKKQRINQSYRFWSGDRQAWTHSGGLLPDSGRNHKRLARSQQHWKQTHSKSPLPAPWTYSDNPPLQSQKVSVSHLVRVDAGRYLSGH